MTPHTITHETLDAPQAPQGKLPRRGLIAGAAAMVAGLMAMKGAEPVAAFASTNIIGDTDASTNGGTLNFIANTLIVRGAITYGAGQTSILDGDATHIVTPTNVAGLRGFGGAGGGTGLVGNGGASGGVGVVGTGGTGSADGVQGRGTGNFSGVRGDAAPNGGTGVLGVGSLQGTNTHIGPGVVGTTFNYTPAITSPAGVVGLSNIGSIPGIHGQATQGDTVGVYGLGANGGAGVYGINSNAIGIGVQGYNQLGTAILGQSSNSYGVYGTSSSSAGVYGSSTTGYGVLASVGSGGVAAVYASSSTPNTPAFYAVNYAAPNPPNSNAGFFIGQVYINGPLVIAGGAKSAAVPHPDGSHRLLYCMESPESWFEDFGVGTITGGKAEVKLDPDFAAVVDTAKLHVFTESHDEHHALHVAKTDATGFTVGVNPSAVGLAAGKKAGDLNGTFTYRVVAKRKDVAAPRLAKFEVPKTPAPALPAKK